MTPKEVVERLASAITVSQESKRAALLARCEEDCPRRLAEAKEHVRNYTDRGYQPSEGCVRIPLTGHVEQCPVYFGQVESLVAENTDKGFSAVTSALAGLPVLLDGTCINICYMCGTLQAHPYVAHCAVCALKQALNSIRITVDPV